MTRWGFRVTRGLLSTRGRCRLRCRLRQEQQAEVRAAMPGEPAKGHRQVRSLGETEGRVVETEGSIVAQPILRGLHHRYGRMATGFDKGQYLIEDRTPPSIHSEFVREVVCH